MTTTTVKLPRDKGRKTGAVDRAIVKDLSAKDKGRAITGGATYCAKGQHIDKIQLS